jgi:hypothetical protein
MGTEFEGAPGGSAMEPVAACRTPEARWPSGCCAAAGAVFRGEEEVHESCQGCNRVIYGWTRSTGCRWKATGHHCSGHQGSRLGHDRHGDTGRGRRQRNPQQVGEDGGCQSQKWE